jgi:hypothetical protein
VRALACALLLLSAAQANETTDAAARRHFLAGQAAYGSGRYAEALGEFTAGYALSPRPEFLYNIGLAYKNLGRTADAIDNLRRFVAAAPGSQYAGPARQLLQQLEQKPPPPKPPEPVKPPPPKPPEPVAVRPPPKPPEPVVVQSAPQPAPDAPPPPPPMVDAPPPPPVEVSERPRPAPPPRKTRTWLWVTIGVVGGAAVLAIGLGVGLAPQKTTYPSTPLPPIDFR